MDRFEIIEILRSLDEVTLMELLGVTSEDLVDAFLDKINDQFPYIQKQIEQER